MSEASSADAVGQFVPRYSDHHGGSAAGGEWIVRWMDAGVHTLAMRYRPEETGEPACIVSFRNRHVYAVVLG